MEAAPTFVPEPEHFDFLRIAESICEQLGDKTWVKKIYKQIEDNAEDSFSSKKKNVGG